MSILGEMIRDEFMADRELDPYGSVRMMMCDLLGAMYLTGHRYLIPSEWQYVPGLTVSEGVANSNVMEILAEDIDSGKINEDDMSFWLRALWMYETLCVIAGRDY